MAAPLRPLAASPAPRRLGRGLLRGVLALLVLACALLAGLSGDRIPAGSPGEAGMTASVAPHHAALVAAMALGDPDDGFDDAVRMAAPVLAARPPAVRLHAPVAASGATAVPMLLERPPRIRA